MEIAAQGLACELSFSQPDAEEWMSTNVQVRVPGFGGQFMCAVQVTEWEKFVNALKQMKGAVGSEATVAWENMEGNIHFTLTLQSSGALSGTYRFSPENFSLGPTLSGSFEADQTYLAEWARSAAEALSNAR